MIHSLKYEGVKEISECLGELLYERLNNEKLGKREELIIVSVPLNKFRERIRGFNQSKLIARYLSDRLGVPSFNALVRQKKTKPQVGLTREERLINVSSAFICIDRTRVKNKIVFLVDDVATTGATLQESAKALKQSGAKKVFGVVVSKRA